LNEESLASSWTDPRTNLKAKKDQPLKDHGQDHGRSISKQANQTS